MTVPAVTAIETLIDDTRVVLEVADEMAAQVERWGIQSHPDGTGPVHQRTAATAAGLAKVICDDAFKHGTGTWAHILTEEFHEALAEADTAALRAELIQVAAVCASWVRDIDRRTRQEPTRA